MSGSLGDVGLLLEREYASLSIPLSNVVFVDTVDALACMHAELDERIRKAKSEKVGLGKDEHASRARTCESLATSSARLPKLAHFYVDEIPRKYLHACARQKRFLLTS